MRRLVARQHVEIALDAEVDGLECKVESILGPVARLQPLAELDDDARALLTRGCLGYMMFTHAGGPVALRGVTLLGSRTADVEFVVVDGIQVAERRTVPRVAMLLPVWAGSVDEAGVCGPPVATVTVNLSIGGALLTRRPGLGDGPRWQLAIALQDDDAPMRCEAQLAHKSATHVGVRFLSLPESDQLRLARTIAGRQRAALASAAAN